LKYMLMLCQTLQYSYNVKTKTKFMVFNATSTIFQLHVYRARGGQFYWWRKPPTCRKSLTNFYHVMLYTSPWSRFELTTSMVISTNCKCSCKSNYHTIMATAAPQMLQCSYNVNTCS
jgi:hypothetical protein